MSSSSDGDLPDWVKRHKVSYLTTITVSSGSDDDLGQPTQDGPAAQPGPSGSTQPPSGNQQGNQQQQQRQQGQNPQQRSSQGAGAAGPSGQAPAVVSGQKTQPGTAQRADPSSVKPNQGGKNASQQEPGPSQHQPTQPTQPGGRSSEVPIILPDKLNKNKVLLELCVQPRQHADDDAKYDLSGDAGAVGRVLVGGKPGAEELRFDLKGVMYCGSVLPLAGTAMVVNIGPSEAKVELLVNDYVRLVEDEAYAALHGGGQHSAEGHMAEALMADIADDENYQLTAAADGGDGDGDGKKVKKKKPTAAGGAKGGGKGGSAAGGGRGGGGKGGGSKLGVKKGGVAKKKKTASKKGSGSGGGKKSAAGAGKKKAK